MKHQGIGWSAVTVGIAMALMAVQPLVEQNWWPRGILLAMATPFVSYGVWRILHKSRPKLGVRAALVAVGQWQTQATTGFQVEVTVTLDWDQPLQLQFTLALPDGTRIENDDYHRAHVSGNTPPGFLDNPKRFDPGQTGPFKIAFLVPADRFAGPPGPPAEGLTLLYESVPPGFASGSCPLDV